MTNQLMRMNTPPNTLEETLTLGKVLAQSGFFQDAKEAVQAVTKILAGGELGFGPIASMTGVNIIKGRVALSANLMAAAIKRSGRYNYRVITHNDTICELAFFENGQEIGRSSFSAEEARRAETQNMHKFPRNMLFARALSNGAKWHCPDIFGGPIYTPEELGAQVDAEGDVISVPSDSPPARQIAPPQRQQPADEAPLFSETPQPASANEALIARLKLVRDGAIKLGLEVRYLSAPFVHAMSADALQREIDATRGKIADRVQECWHDMPDVPAVERDTKLDALADDELLTLAADVKRRWHAGIAAVAA